MIMKAGFRELSMTSIEFPAAVALTAAREGEGVADAVRHCAEAERETETARLQALVAEQARLIEAMRHSRSWRVTAPMRFAGTLAHRLLSRLGTGDVGRAAPDPM